MIKSVTVTNYLGDSIKLELARPELSGFVITNISGLGPGKADVNTTEISTSDGGLYNSARMPARNIVIGVKYFQTVEQSIEDVRQLSYKYFPIKKKLTLFVETDNRQAEIEGYVETNDPNIFNKTDGSRNAFNNYEGSDISIICPDPFFYSAGRNGTNTTVFSGVESMFEFPFSNDLLTENLLEFGTIQNKTENLLVYNGDSEIGITMTIHAIGEASNITIHNTRTRETMKIDTVKLAAITGSGIIAGDDITICTIKGKKSVTLLRNGITINILNCLGKNPDWFQLSKGDNVFAYIAETGSTNLQFSITNKVIYEGV